MVTDLIISQLTVTPNPGMTQTFASRMTKKKVNTNSMTDSSYTDTNKPQDAKRIHHLWSPEILHHFHNNPPLVPTMCQTKALYSFIYCFLDIHFKINLPSKPKTNNTLYDCWVTYW